MKTKLTLLILILFSCRIFGQLQVDAGNDTILCLGVWGVDTTEIGGNPTASGGVEPYIYIWSANYTIGSLSYEASHFLDDTTKSNPKLVHDSGGDIQFKLTVIDDIGTQAEDSITIGFSGYAYILQECRSTINQGDTARLFAGMGGGVGPLSYAWFPNYNISDTTMGSPEAWPDTTTYYYVYATDSIGCVSETTECWISVHPAGISSIQGNLKNSIVYPNPINSNSVIKLAKVYSNDLCIEIVNSFGQIILIDKFSSSQYALMNKIFKKGIYFYVIKNKTNVISRGRFVK